jgi:hypothetical protein
MFSTKEKRAELWNNREIRQTIEDRIIRKAKYDSGKTLSRLDITEKKVLQEYRSIWLDSIKKKDKTNMLYNHPNLL